MRLHSVLKLVFIRWATLSIVLAAELLGLTARFDAQQLLGSEGLLAECVARARWLPEMLTAAAAVLLIARAGRLRRLLVRLALRSATQHKWWTSAIAQLVAFTGLVLVSAQVFDSNHRSSIWMAGWLALATASVAFFLGAWAPFRAWFEFVSRERSVLAASAGAGCLAMIAGHLTQRLGEPLGDATFRAVAGLLGRIYPNVHVGPGERVLGVGDFSVEIAPHCSGFEGLGLMAVFIAAFLWIFRESLRFPQAFLLTPLGLVGIWLGNVVRIAALITIGASWSPGIALGGFHSQAGWIAFNLMALALMGIALRVRFFSRFAEPAEGEAGPRGVVVWSDSDAAASVPGQARRLHHNSSQPGEAGPDVRGAPTNVSAYLVPFLVLTAVGMTCAALQSGLDLGYPLKIIAAGLALWWFRGSFGRLCWNGSWSAVIAGTIVFGLWMVLDRSGGAGGDLTLRDELSRLAPRWASMWIYFKVIGSVVAVPIVEELAFRGYLMRRWAAVGFEQVPFTRCPWVAVAVTSVLFGVLHGRWFAGTLAGLVYAIVLRRRGNFGDAVLAHAVTNAQIAATVLFAGAWQLWA